MALTPMSRIGSTNQMRNTIKQRLAAAFGLTTHACPHKSVDGSIKRSDTFFVYEKVKGMIEIMMKSIDEDLTGINHDV